MLSDLYILKKHDWRAEVFVAMCGFNYFQDENEMFTDETFELKVNTFANDTYATNLVRRILKLAKVPPEHFKVSEQNKLFASNMVGQITDMSYYNTQINLSYAFSAITDVLQYELLGNKKTFE